MLIILRLRSKGVCPKNARYFSVVGRSGTTRLRVRAGSLSSLHVRTWRRRLRATAGVRLPVGAGAASCKETEGTFSRGRERFRSCGVLYSRPCISTRRPLSICPRGTDRTNGGELHCTYMHFARSYVVPYIARVDATPPNILGQ